MNRLDILFGFVILAFIGLYLSVALPSDFRDVQHNSQWRMQHAWDEGQNIARTKSLLEYSYRENPIVSRSLNQFYLMIASQTQKLFSDKYNLETRITLALRVAATISMVLIFIFFYLLCRMVTTCAPAFLTWVLFASASWAYLPIGSTAKEDAFCVWVTICIAMSIISLIRHPATWKIYFTAVLIGIGGATKQYPLSLALIIAFYFWERERNRLKCLVAFTKFMFVIVVTIAIANPNYYLAKFVVNTPAEVLLFIRHNQNGLYSQLISSWVIFKAVVLQRYTDLITVIFLLCGLHLISSHYRTKGSQTFQFLVKNKRCVFSFLATYYCVSLYKQNYYTSVRYFMVGEILFFLLLSVLIERMFELQNLKLKLFVLFIFAFQALGINLKRGNFNLSLQVSSAEHSLKESIHSTFDDLKVYLLSLSHEQRSRIMSHWYVYIPEEFKPTYIQSIAHGYSEAEVYLERTYGFKMINAELNKDVLKRERPTIFLSLLPMHESKEDYTQCFKLLNTIKSEDPQIYSNFFSALLGFHRTRVSLSRGEKENSKPAGSSVYIYDTKSCY